MMHLSVFIIIFIFIAENNNAEHEIGQFKNEDIERQNHIHDILHEILKVTPM